MNQQETSSRPPLDPIVQEAIEMSWCAETSVDPENWDCFNPASGQCAVTALVVQDERGGTILRGEIAGKGSHYWNQLPDGREVDLTIRQFKFGGKPLRPEPRSREYLLSNADTKRRYELLKERVDAWLDWEFEQ